MSGIPLKILSYNIHKGFSLGNRRFVLSRIREALRSVPVDLVFLQEVLGHHDEHAKRIADWPLTSQFEFLADEVWSHFAYGKNAIYESGHHGNAILSKYPITGWSNIDLSTNPLESRGCLHAIISIPQCALPLHALCVHLNLLKRSRGTQIRQVCQRINEVIPKDEPYVLAGDFNDWSQKASALLEKEAGARELSHSLNGRHAPTFPSRYPLFSLDRIYVRGFTPVSVTVLKGAPWDGLSDHAALYGEVELKNKVTSHHSE